MLFIKNPGFHCAKCGAKDSLDNYSDDCELLSIMREKGVCYECAFWIKQIEHSPSNVVIIDHKYYLYNNDILLQTKKEYFILYNNREIFYTKKLLFVRDIPEIFWNELPDNASFISERIFNKLDKDNHQCYAKGCWDRYHCYRYKLEIEKDGEPFNYIPDKYVIGTEYCPSFINKFKMSVK